MRRDKTFDAVGMMRDIRDRMSADLKGMTPAEQNDRMDKTSGLRERPKKRAATASGNGWPSKLDRHVPCPGSSSQ